jgi:hypothetical protein
MIFDRKKLEYDCDKLLTMQEVRAKYRGGSGTILFHYPFGEFQFMVERHVKFVVESNKVPNLRDYGLCKYKCGRMWYHAIFYVTAQTSRGKIMRDKIRSGKIKVGRKAKAK